MSNPYFRFKQFIIRQDRCAMKVGTDGVLLGAWVETAHARTILDVGCGTGLLSLMCAQRSDAHILGIEIDEEAAKQAMENVSSSPWSDRITIEHVSFQEYVDQENVDQEYDDSAEVCSQRQSTADKLALCSMQNENLSKDVEWPQCDKGRFDLVISNPPYFSNSLKSPREERTKARHTDTLTFEELTKGVVRLMRDGGRFAVILPYDVMTEFVEIARESGLRLIRGMEVYSIPPNDSRSTPCRFMAEFSKVELYKTGEELIPERLVIESGGRHQYSDAYIQMTKEFYLKM